MTTEYLEAMKADLLETYKDDLCEESIESIQNAHTLQEFIGVLHRYAAFLKYKAIPKIEWVRKWFADYKEEAQACGAYIDAIASVTNPTTPIIAFGQSYITFIATKSEVYTITLQDTSECSIVAYYASFIKVRQKDESKVKVLHKGKLSNVKIRKV